MNTKQMLGAFMLSGLSFFAMQGMLDHDPNHGPKLTARAQPQTNIALQKKAEGILQPILDACGTVQNQNQIYEGMKDSSENKENDAQFTIALKAFSKQLRSAMASMTAEDVQVLAAMEKSLHATKIYEEYYTQNSLAPLQFQKLQHRFDLVAHAIESVKMGKGGAKSKTYESGFEDNWIPGSRRRLQRALILITGFAALVIGGIVLTVVLSNKKKASTTGN